MLVYPVIDPVMLDFGFIKIHWYGFMYLLSFVVALLFSNYQYKNDNFWNFERISDLVVYVAFGVVVGGRIGYVLFYGFSEFLANPFYLFYIWQGGMSFHGGVLGVIFTMYLFSKKSIVVQVPHHKKPNKMVSTSINKSFLEVADFVTLLIPIGLFFGRIGNFINSELWGKITDNPLGMLVYDPILQKVVAKYPSQLLEAFLEGLVLFIVLQLFKKTKPNPGSISALFILLYGIFRFLVEFIRVPDTHIGYLAFDWLTIGQILSSPMIIVGVLLLYLFNKKPKNT